MSEAIALSNGDFFSPEQRKMIRDSFLGGASDSEAAVLLEVARIRHLNPLTGQIHFIKRRQYDDRSGGYIDKWAYQTAIDGLRATAERSGKYDGQDEPEFEYDEKGKLKFARVRVYKKGVSRPFVGIAHWSEYVQSKKDGSPTKMWNEKPHIMLSKCAEALGLRKAFPEETSGLYTDEEMDRGERETVEASPPSAKPARTASVQIVEVDTKALAGRRVEADATLTDKLKESVAVGAAASPAGAEATVAAPDPEAPSAGQPGQPLPPGPSKLEQILALLDEVRLSGGWKSKQRMREWCEDYKAHIDSLSVVEKDTVRGAINVCGFRK